MAAVAITGAIWPSFVSSRLGPFRDGSGDLWVIAYNSTPKITAYKSSDGGATWGTSYSDTVLTYITDFLDCVFDSTNGIIYVLTSTTGHRLQIVKFTISSHLWSYVSSGLGPVVYVDASSQYPALLVRRSDGTFVVFHQGPTASNMGTAYRQVHYAVCAVNGTWGSATLVYGLSGSQLHVDAKGAVLGASDRTHMLCENSQPDAYHRSLSSANALDTAGLVDTGGLSTFYYQMIYDATLGKIVAGIWGIVRRATSEANPTWSPDTNYVGSDEPGTCNPAFHYDVAGSRLYVFFRDVSSDDVYVNSTSSTTWVQGDAKQQDATTAVTGISVGAITNAIGVVFNDSGMYFDKYSLAAPLPNDAKFLPLL